LIRDLPSDNPARIEGEHQIARLEKLAREGQSSGHMQQHEQPLPSLTVDPTKADQTLG
jgi:hypothetical protein